MKRTKCFIIKRILFAFLFWGTVIYIFIEKKRLQALIKLNEKNHLLYLLSTQWLYRKINGEEVFACLKDNGYKKIAVYGKNHSCECLCSELENIGIEVAGIIDGNAVGRYGDIPIITKDKMPKDVDAVIITNLVNAELIANNLKEEYTVPIFTLEDIIKWG